MQSADGARSRPRIIARVRVFYLLSDSAADYHIDVLSLVALLSDNFILAESALERFRKQSFQLVLGDVLEEGDALEVLLQGNWLPGGLHFFYPQNVVEDDALQSRVFLFLQLSSREALIQMIFSNKII